MPLNSSMFALAYSKISMVTSRSNDDGKAKHNDTAFGCAIQILHHLVKGRTKEEIASELNHSIEMVSVWIDYLDGINWLRKKDGKWEPTDQCKRYLQLSREKNVKI
jgi:hypothetical protein